MIIIIIIHVLALFACIFAALVCALFFWRSLHVRLQTGCLFPAVALVLEAAFLTSAVLLLTVRW